MADEVNLQLESAFNTLTEKSGKLRKTSRGTLLIR